MDRIQRQKAAAYIYAAQTGLYEIEKVTEALLPGLTDDEAYDIQEELIQRYIDEGEALLGPKLGLTSKAKLEQMHVKSPVYGYIFKSMLIENNGQVSLSRFIHPKAEPEIGVILKESLCGPNASLSDAEQAVGWVFPALEIIDSRYKGFSFTVPDVICDNTSASGCVFGESAEYPLAIGLDEIPVIIKVNGETIHSGYGRDIYSHPLEAIAWLANMLWARGKKLEAGVPIMAGAATAAVPFHEGDHITSELGGIGGAGFYCKA